MIYGVNLFQLKNGYKQTNLTKIEKKSIQAIVIVDY